MDEKEYMIGISKAPDDPEAKKKWAHDMMRMQVALWIDGGATCEMCGHQYESVDDFLDRNVRWGGPGKFVDGDCWDLYKELAIET